MDPPPGLDLALPPFSLLDAAGRARLLDSLDMGFHPAGEILMSAGQPSAHVYVLLKGQARAYDLDQDGREQPFADYGPGEVFGAWAAITGSSSCKRRRPANSGISANGPIRSHHASSP